MDKETLLKLYLEENKTAKEIAGIFKVDPTTVRRWLRKYGIRIRKYYEYCQARKFLQDKEFLYQQYIVNKKSTTEIGKELKCDTWTVYRYLKSHQIPIRSISESLKGTRIGCIVWNKGKKCPQLSGKNNLNWEGGVTSKHHSFRTSLEYRDFQREVWERDNYTCVCGFWLKPHTHHLLPLWYNWEERLNPLNGITLCKKHHEEIKGAELKYALLFSLILLKKRVNSGKPLNMGNPEPSVLPKGERMKVQRLLEEDTSSLITSKNALPEREEIVLTC